MVAQGCLFTPLESYLSVTTKDRILFLQVCEACASASLALPLLNLLLTDVSHFGALQSIVDYQPEVKFGVS